MKRILQIVAFALLITLGNSCRTTALAQGYDDQSYQDQPQGNDDISYQTFYDELSPYGQWIDYPNYGYVWVPNEGPDFRPYSSGGHWVWSDDYDWIWVSDYSWGWAPFHYGRWFSDPVYGWMWMPGYEWAPAWVAWRDGGDYYGWAPLGPGFNIGLSFSTYNPPVDYWCFAERRYITSARIYDYCLDRSRNVTIINTTTIINNYGRRNNVFIGGPRRDEAERYAGRISSVRFREANRPGSSYFRNNEVSVYRPRVNQNNGRQFTPRNFERYDRNRSNNNGNVIGRDRNNNNNPRNGNNLPGRRDGNDNSRFDRGNNNGVAQQNNNDGRFDRRGGFDRRNNQPEDRRTVVPRSDNQPQPQQQPGNDRRVDRNNNVFQRRNDPPANNDRRNFEPRNNTQPQPQQQPANDNRRFDRGGGSQRNNNPMPQRQMERSQPSQPRQFENRSGGGGNNHEQHGGGGHGRRG